MVGCISDQYQYLVKGKNKKRRNVLLILGIVQSALSMILLVQYLRLVGVAAGMMLEGSYTEEAILHAVISGSGSVSLLALPILGVSVAHAVFYYMSVYDMYASCAPHEAILFLILGLLFKIAEPIFHFVVRKRDDGMPPRRRETPNYNCYDPNYGGNPFENTQYNPQNPYGQGNPGGESHYGWNNGNGQDHSSDRFSGDQN